MAKQPKPAFKAKQIGKKKDGVWGVYALDLEETKKGKFKTGKHRLIATLFEASFAGRSAENDARWLVEQLTSKMEEVTRGQTAKPD